VTKLTDEEANNPLARHPNISSITIHDAFNVPIFNNVFRVPRHFKKSPDFWERMHDKLGNGGRTEREYTVFGAH
ncbi:hypothetical protein L9F63_016435, partial [Diploptera punctata]